MPSLVIPFLVRRLRYVVLLSVALAHSACQSTAPPRPVLSPTEMAKTLPEDARVLDSIDSHNAELRKSFVSLRASGEWRKSGYFSAVESDRMELLLFRFHNVHHHLNDIAERYEKIPKEVSDKEQVREVGERAHQIAHKQSRFLVDTFADDPVAISKINQAYPRSEIPRHTYDKLVDSLKAPLKREADIVKQKIDDDMDDASYKAQSVLFYRVSRLRLPSAYLIVFSDAQKRELLSALQPGDILLSYTAGYASDVFIPGAFKHGITFVGTVEQRKAAGLSPDDIILVGGSHERSQLTKDLRRSTTRDGRPANLIEAVAEGVKFSNLEHIMDTHVNRLLVLRPRLSSGDRAKQVSRLFSYHGQDYDFRFDFADASRQVCTEVIYRSLTGLNGLEFPLTRRGGHVTLSADDLVNYWLHQNPDAFEFVMYAEEAPLSPNHRARLYAGADGKRRVERLMASEDKE